MKNLFLLLLALCFVRLEANQTAPPCTFFVEGEFLYMMPDFGSTLYTIENLDASPLFLPEVEGTSHRNQLYFLPGFRVTAGYSFNNPLTAWIDWTQFNISGSDGFTGGQYLTEGVAGGNPGFSDFIGISSRRDKLDFYALRGNIDFLFYTCPWANIVLQGAIQAGYVIHDEVVRAQNAFLQTLDFNRKSRTNFLGITGGVGLQVPLCNFGLTFLAEGNGGYFTGKLYEEISMTNTAFSPFMVHYDPVWRVIPYFNFKWGLGFRPCCCESVYLEVGYEYISYLNMLSHTIAAMSAAQPLTTAEYNPLAFQGLYVKGQIAF